MVAGKEMSESWKTVIITYGDRECRRKYICMQEDRI